MNAYAWSAAAAAALAGFLLPAPSSQVLAGRRLGWRPGRTPLIGPVPRRPLAGTAAKRAGNQTGNKTAEVGRAGTASTGTGAVRTGGAVGAVGTLTLLAAWFGPAVVGFALVLGAALAAAASIRRSRKARAAAAEVGKAACEACEVMAAELRAGRTPAQALEAGSAVLPPLAPAAAAALLGGDVAAALGRIDVPGAHGLRPLAAAWAVAETGGARLAVVIDRLAAGLREDSAIRDEVRAALAAPRSTARVLAALPLAGVALGYGMGADPAAFLLGSPAGIGCLVGGAVLALAGLVWVERLARSAEDRS